MKIKYLFTLLASALLFVGCSNDDAPVGSLVNISVSQSYLTIPTTGGTTTVTIKSSESWKIVTANGDAVEDTISTDTGEKLQQTVNSKGKKTLLWCKLSTLTGEAGETVLSITAPADNAAHETEFHIACGKYNTQVVNIKQGVAKAETATCADVIAGVDGKSYRVKGTVTAIANTTYGNWYLNDGTGEVYIYGTYDKDGKDKNFASLGIEVGDIVEVEGPKKTYGSTIELENVTVNSITKSLIKVISEEASLDKNGGELNVKVAYKGNGAFVEIPDTDLDWVRYKSTDYIKGVVTKLEKNPADTAVFKFDIKENDGGMRSTVLSLTSGGSKATYAISQEGSVIKGSIAAFNQAADGAEFTLAGVVTSIKNSTYGNMYISDGTGEAYIYGTLTPDGQSKQFSTLGINEGDVVILKGTKGSYNGDPQMKDATYVKHISVPGGVKAVSVEQFLAAPEDKETYYMLTGSVGNIANTTYGNFDLVDLTGSIYVYGLLTEWGGESKKFDTLGITEGTAVSILGVRTSYKGTPQVGNGAFVKKAE